MIVSELTKKVLVNKEKEDNTIEETNEIISKKEDTSSEIPRSDKEVTKHDTLKCTDCDYEWEKNIFMIKHVNTKHRKSLKC